MPQDGRMESEPTRRTFFKAALVPALAAVAATAAVDDSQAQEALPDALPRRFIVGKPDIPPLDTPILFAREGSHEAGHTHEVLSLIQEEKGGNAFPWTVYAQLRTHHTGGDAVVFYSRLHKEGPGWSCGFHSEVFARNWGVGIGMNIELGNQYEGTEGFNGVIGIEVQSLGPKPTLAGLQIEGAGPFENMIRLRGHAATGIDMSGQCGVGINLHGNSLRIDEGGWIELDQDGQVRMRYHEGNIEFFKGEQRIAHIPVDGEDHAL